MSDQFDLFAGRAARDAAMQQADENADPDWKAVMSQLICEVARHQPIFSSDDVFRLKAARGGPTTHEPRAFGPLMIAAAKAGVCERTDRVIRSTRVSNHTRPIQLWRSLINTS